MMEQLEKETEVSTQLFKVLLIGDSGVGKSSILLRYSDNAYTGNYITTIGVDFKIKTLIVNNQHVKLQIWDTAGQERFRTITSTYYRGTHGVIIVYDVTNRSSFESVQRWLSEIEQYCNSVDRILVGNKTEPDVLRAIGTDEAQSFAQSRNIQYIETSARNDVNIDTLFVKITELMLKTKQQQRQQANGRSGDEQEKKGIRLSSVLNRENRRQAFAKIKLC